MYFDTFEYGQKHAHFVQNYLTPINNGYELRFCKKSFDLVLCICRYSLMLQIDIEMKSGIRKLCICIIRCTHDIKKGVSTSERIFCK